MCSLCGMLSGQAHWTESASAPSVFAARDELHTRHRERQTRTRLVNAILKHYGLELTDWSGASYILSNRTGRSVMVNNLGELWGEAECMLGRSCDPLDERLIAFLHASIA
jgi:hypothetical protein